MHIKQLTVQGVRNLSPQTLEPDPRINLLAGDNGSGKTSLLEAIYLLGRGRSFRARAIKTVINAKEGVEECTVFALLAGQQVGVSGPSSSSILPVGVSRETKGGFRFKVDGELVSSASPLAEVLPLVLLNTESFQLLAGGPVHRRAYLDRGLFHTCSNFKNLWRQQQRALKQRNALLKQAKSKQLDELDWWDEQFAVLSEQLTGLRENYLESIYPVVQDILCRLTNVSDIAFSYRRGWDSNKSLREALKLGRGRDIMAGNSQVGPHRADLRIICRQQDASQILSRGQIKSLIVAMMLAQGVHYRKKKGKDCVFLVDDLPAELDSTHQQRIAELLAETGCQVFITGVDEEQLIAPWEKLGWQAGASASDKDKNEKKSFQDNKATFHAQVGASEGKAEEVSNKGFLKVFHVKHGEIRAAV